MSGHSKWAKIKRQKGVEDQKRGLEFSKLTRIITTAVIQGKSGDPGQSSTLRLAIEKARQINMPKANIERAIARGLGKGDGGSLEQVTLEGYGPGGVAVMVGVMTDNRQRTTAQVRSVFERWGGNLGSPGSAAFLFERGSDGKFTAKSLIPVAEEDKDRLRQLVEAIEENEDVDWIAHSGGDLGSEARR